MTPNGSSSTSTSATSYTASAPYEEIDIDLCNKFREYLLTADELQAQGTHHAQLRIGISVYIQGASENPLP